MVDSCKCCGGTVAHPRTVQNRINTCTSSICHNVYASSAGCSTLLHIRLTSLSRDVSCLSSIVLSNTRVEQHSKRVAREVHRWRKQEWTVFSLRAALQAAARSEGTLSNQLHDEVQRKVDLCMPLVDLWPSVQCLIVG